jgi:hypothetical protein
MRKARNLRFLCQQMHVAIRIRRMMSCISEIELVRSQNSSHWTHKVGSRDAIAPRTTNGARNARGWQTWCTSSQTSLTFSPTSPPRPSCYLVAVTRWLFVGEGEARTSKKARHRAGPGWAGACRQTTGVAMQHPGFIRSAPRAKGGGLRLFLGHGRLFSYQIDAVALKETSD